MPVPISLRGEPIKCWWRDPESREWCGQAAIRDIGHPPKWFCEKHAQEHMASYPSESIDQGGN